MHLEGVLFVSMGCRDDGDLESAERLGVAQALTLVVGAIAFCLLAISNGRESATKSLR